MKKKKNFVVGQLEKQTVSVLANIIADSKRNLGIAMDFVYQLQSFVFK